MAHPYFSTLDVTAGTNVLDFSSYYYRKPLPGDEAKLINLVAKREDVPDKLITWFEDADIPVTAAAVNTSAGDLAELSGTSLTFASGVSAASFLRVGTQLHDTADGKAEIIELTVDGAGEEWTIERSKGTAPPEAHDRAAVWEIIGTPQYEGSGFGRPVGANRSARTNTTTILDEQIKLTRSQLRQIMHAVSDNWVWTQERALRHFERIMERNLIWSQGVTRAAGEAGSCKGIYDLIVQYGDAALRSTDFGTWKYSAIDAVLGGFYDRGVEGDLVILAGRSALTAAAYWNQSAIRTDRTDTTRGLRATHILSTMNQLIPIIPVAGLGNRFIVGPLEKLAMRFVDTMLAYDIPLGEAGNDYAARRWISEYTVELHDAATDWYLGEGVDYVIPED